MIIIIITNQFLNWCALINTAVFRLLPTFLLHSIKKLQIHMLYLFIWCKIKNVHTCIDILDSSVVTIPNFAMRCVSRYLGHDAIRIAIHVYRVSQCLHLQFVYDGNVIYMPRYTLLSNHNRCRICWSLTVA